MTFLLNPAQKFDYLQIIFFYVLFPVFSLQKWKQFDCSIVFGVTVELGHALAEKREDPQYAWDKTLTMYILLRLKRNWIRILEIVDIDCEALAHMNPKGYHFLACCPFEIVPD